jgi:RNA polymerase sigma factor (sigma-70 family)
MQIKSDRELIESYAMARNDAAFAELVAHYSPMVYRACLRVLGNASDAEDATQAAFLVLARKAGSLRQEGRLNGWLHRVARQVALQALRVRADRERRQEHVAVLQESMTVDTPEVDREVVFQAVDAELDGLSAILREAIVLRYLRGFSEQAAASAAGCPLGTMKRRASEGIAKLRQRLAKRGVALGGVALASLLTSEASAAIPETLLPSILATVKTAAATTAAATGATTTAAVLAKGAMKAMFIAKVKMVAAVASLAVAGGGALVAQEVAAQRKAAEQPPAAAKTVVESWAAEVGEMDLMTVKSFTVAQAEALVKWQAQKPAFQREDNFTDTTDLRTFGATPEQIQRLRIDTFDTPPNPRGNGFLGPMGLNYGNFLCITTSREWLRLGNGAQQFLTLPALDTLTPEVAAVLSKLKGGDSPATGWTRLDLHLPGLTTLTPDAAAALAEFGGTLFLSGLTNLTPDVAVAFAKFRGEQIVFSRLTALMPEAAAALARLKHPGSLDLSGLTNLTLATAAALARFEGSEIFLDGLTTLTPETAAALATGKGPYTTTYLSGLDTLTPETAAALANWKNGSPFLGGPRSITPETAAALATFKKTLCFPGLRTFTPEVAHALGQFKGDRFIAHGVMTMSPEARDALLKNDKRLEVWGLGLGFTDQMAAAVAEADRMTTLTPETAKAVVRVWSCWGNITADSLRLPNLTNLTTEVAAALASYGDAPDYNGRPRYEMRRLYLPALTTLTPEAAGELLKFRGRLHLSGRNLDLTPKAVQILAKSANWDGYLPGLTTLTPQVATALATCNGERLGLGGLTTLTPEAAAALAKFEGPWLTLGGLTNVSPEIAAALVNYKGGLCLPDLNTLTPEIAAALARRTGSLTLPGLTTLTPEAAVALAKFGGDGLYLTGLTALKPETAVALAKFRGARIEIAVLSLTPGAATALAEFGGQKLDLHRLMCLTPEAAAELANYNGALYLPALTTLTPEVAAVLAKSGSRWLLLGLRALTPEVAAALANYKGGLTLDVLRVPERDVTWFTPETIAALAKFEGEVLELPGFWESSWWSHGALASFRAKQIEIHGVGSMESETLAKLTKKSRNSNRSLTTLSPERLAAMANYGGKEIHLDSLTELTHEAAAALAKFTGEGLYLDHLKTLDPDAAAALAKCKAKVSLPNNLKLPKP